MSNEIKDKMIKYVRLHRLNLIKGKGDDDYAKLEWAIREGSPRITVYTTNKREPGSKLDFNTVITAPFTFLTFLNFIKKIKKVILSETKTECKIDCLNNKFVDGKRTNELYLQATVVVYKTDDGKIFISVTEKDKEKIDFQIQPDKYFIHYDESGEPIKDMRLRTKEYALGYINIIETLMIKNCNVDNVRENFIPPPAYKQKQPEPKQEDKPIVKHDINFEEGLESLV